MQERSRMPEQPSSERNATDDQRFVLGFLLHDVSHLRRRVLDDAFRPLSLSRAQWWTLGNLSLRGQTGIIQTDLARLMDVKKVTIGTMIDQLEARGYVERRGDTEDRRVRRIYLTPLGKKTVAEISRIVRELTPQLTDGISDGEIAVMEKTLSRMRANLQGLLGEDIAPPPDRG